jgi:hypothetical protein
MTWDTTVGLLISKASASDEITAVSFIAAAGTTVALVVILAELS